jgi:hypothetical protein
MRWIVGLALVAFSVPAWSATAGLRAPPHLLLSAQGHVVGAAGLGTRCSDHKPDPDPEVVDQCAPMDWTGVVISVGHDRQGFAKSLTFRRDGFKAPIDIALGDGAMQLDDSPPVPAAVQKAIAAWLRSGLRLRVVGTINGADGGMVIATSLLSPTAKI